MDLKERNNSMRDFFNRKSDGYDDVHSKFMETKNEMIDSLNINVKNILDLGAGTGLELIHLYGKNPDVHTTVIDISENMLEVLKKRSFSNKVTFICGDFFEEEFGNNYDAVISTSALHHFLKDSKLKLYRKIYDCLKQDGEFINSDKIVTTNEEEEQLLDEYNKEKDIRAHIDTPLSIEHEVEILQEAGFKKIEVCQTDKENYRLIKAKK